MSDSNVIKLGQPGAFADSLTDILRQGARALLTQAVEAEVAEFLGRHAGLKTEDGNQRVVRHGHLPEREIMTGIGPVAVRQPRVRDREVGEEGRIRFSPSILPPYARRSRSLEVLIPILYLKGISTGDFEEALAALVGRDAPGLSASTIARLKEVWSDEHERWHKRDLSAKRYVYFWADGIHLEARLEEQAQCILVIIGATPEGKKELVGFTDGLRESSESWRDLLLDLRRRGLTAGPELAVAGGARAAMLGAQDREHPKQAAQEPSLKSQAGVAGDLDGRDESRCPNRVWRLHRELRTEIRKSRRLPAQRSRGAAGVL